MNTKDRLNDKFLTDAPRFQHLLELDPEVPEHVWRTIIRYEPRLSPVQWEAVREAVITAVLAVKPRTHGNTRRMMSIISRFYAWAWTITGGQSAPERVFTESTIHRYLAAEHSERSHSYRYGVVRQLAVIAKAMAGVRVEKIPAPTSPGERAPFTPAEIAALHSWAQALSTRHKRQNAWTILGLAGGAGLRTDELVEIRLRHITTIDGRLWVHVPGPRQRDIPVLHPWGRTLLRALEGRADPDELLFRGFRLEEYPPRTVQDFLTQNPGRVRATVTRLRSSWICTHLRNGIPIDILMHVAGLNAASLLWYVRHLPATPIDPYLGLLTGEEVAR